MLVGGSARMVWCCTMFPMPRAGQAQIADGLDQMLLHDNARLLLRGGVGSGCVGPGRAGARDELLRAPGLGERHDLAPW
jgi:hypothetical protein